MPQKQYLKRLRSGVYVVRMYVPRQLQQVLGKKEVHVSTRCRDLPLAKVVASSLIADWHRRVASLQSMDPTKVIAGSLDLIGDGLILLDQAAEQLGSDRVRLAEHLLQRQAAFFVRLVDQDGWLIKDIGSLYHDIDETGLASVDISDSELQRHGEQRRLSRDVALRFPDEVRSLVSSAGPQGICQFMLHPIKQMGFVVPVPGLPVHSSSLLVRKLDVETLRQTLLPLASVQLERVHSVAVEATARTALNISSYCEPKYANTRLSELVRRHIDAGRASWRPDTLKTKEGVGAMFVELTEDICIGQLDRDVLWSVAKQASCLPVRRDLVKRRFKVPDATSLDLIRLADEHGLERLTPLALESLIADMGEFLKWAVKQGMLTRNPADGLADDVFRSVGGKHTAAAQQRLPMSQSDLQQIFGADWFKAGIGQRSKHGRFFHFRPHYYWLPLLGLYAGGRINELAQLYLADIVEEPDGTAYIDFNLKGEDKLDLDGGDSADTGRESATDKSLKNVNAERLVPIHPALIEYGLLEYARALRAAGYQRLFPELAFDRVKGYGKAPSSWFNERFLGRELGIPRDGKKTFHSLRHNFSTALGDALVPSPIKSQLVGHSRGQSTTEMRYDKGRAARQLAEHLAKISFALPPIAAFKVNEGLAAVVDALALKTRHQPRQAEEKSES